MRPHRLVLAGFGAFAKRTEVDFDRLSEHGLYLIIGDTGSGKTTIFDAMTYALYGEVAGNRDKQSMASEYDDRDEPYVEFKFSHKNCQYLVKRTLEGKNPSDHMISILDSTGSPVHTETGKSNIKTFVEERIKLDADQFMKVVLLPQNQFQKFLVANSSEREKLLQALFGTYQYQEISDSLMERARLKVDEAETVIGKLKSNEITAQEIIDGLPSDSKFGDVPRLELGYEQTLDALRRHKKKSDEESRLLSAAATEAAKKAQAVSDGAELFDANKELSELVLIRDEQSKPTAHALERLENHKKAVPVSNAFKSEKKALEDKAEAEATLKEIEDKLSKIIRANRTVNLIGDIKKTRSDGIASTNAYVARMKAAVLGARDKYKEATDYQNSGEESRILIDESLNRKKEIEIELKQIKSKHKKLTLEQKQQQHFVSKLSNLKARALALDNLLEVADVAAAKAQLRIANLEYTKAAEHFLVAQQALKDAHDLRTRHLAGELGHSLKRGKECPVCGSISHPRKAKRSKMINIEVLEKKRTKAQRQQGQAEVNLKSCQSQLAKAVSASKKLPTKQVQSKLRSELKAATKASTDLERISKSLVALSKSISLLESESSVLETEVKNQTKIEKESIAKSMTLITAAKSIISEDEIEGALDAVNKIQALINDLDSAERKVVSAVGKAEESSSNLQKVLKVSGFTSIAIAISAECDDASLTEFERVIKESETRETQITRLEGRTKDKIIPQERPDAETAEKNLEVAKKSATIAAELANSLGTALTVVESLVNNQKTIGVNAIKDLEFAKSARSLADKFRIGTTGANGLLGLERWVQRHLFREVCQVSNTYIRSLFNGRYELTLEPQVGREKSKAGGLDLYVIDAQSGKSRQVQNLSGGETFLVSLALALSLAEVVQNIFGAIELSSLFIDEGFGTLDADTLESAMSLLNSIQSDGRSIGIISHVGQMHLRLPIGLKVRKTSRGSSVVHYERPAVIS